MQIVIRSSVDGADDWSNSARAALHAQGVAPGGDAADVFVIPSDAANLPGLLATREARGGQGTAYVCSGMTCQAPVLTPDALAGALAAALPAP